MWHIYELKKRELLFTDQSCQSMIIEIKMLREKRIKKKKKKKNMSVKQYRKLVEKYYLNV